MLASPRNCAQSIAMSAGRNRAENPQSAILRSAAACDHLKVAILQSSLRELQAGRTNPITSRCACLPSLEGQERRRFLERAKPRDPPGSVLQDESKLTAAFGMKTGRTNLDSGARPPISPGRTNPATPSPVAANGSRSRAHGSALRDPLGHGGEEDGANLSLSGLVRLLCA